MATSGLSYDNSSVLWINYYILYIDYIYMSRKMRGTLLRASAKSCAGKRSGGNDLPRSQAPYLNVGFG